MRSWWWAALLVGAVGCGPRFKPESYPTPEALFDASKQAYQRGKCGAAILGFTRALFELPARDPRVAEARYLMAECRFKEGDYLQASLDFRRVADDFPNGELAPTALMRAGDALARLWKHAELDPTYGEQAVSTYSEALTRYPDAPVAARVREQSVALADKFAAKDLKNGDFYYRMHAYDSAMIYYRSIVASYPQSKFASAALMRLVRTYRKIGYDDEVTETCAHLRQYYADADGLDRVCPPPAAP